MVTNGFSPYNSVTDMIGELGWRSLELRRYDTRLTMFYKIVHGYVAIIVPSQFEHLTTNARPSGIQADSHICLLQLLFFFPYDVFSLEQIARSVNVRR